MSERIWAVIDGGVVGNIIVADDAFVTLISANHDDVLEITGMTSAPGPAWTWDGSQFRAPQPYASWVWTGETWEAPVAVPDTPGAWAWDENAQEWIDTTPPAE